MKFICGILGVWNGAVTFGLLTAWLLDPHPSSTSYAEGDKLILSVLACLVGGGVFGLVTAEKIRLRLCARESSPYFWRKFLFAYLVLIGTLTGFCWLHCSLLQLITYAGYAPTDEQMIENFERREPTFNELVSMVHNDDFTGSIFEKRHYFWAGSKSGSDSCRIKEHRIPAKRLERYQELMRFADVPSAINGTGRGGNVSFQHWFTSGGGYSRSAKGYTYFANALPSTMPSLDHVDSMTGRAHRHIKGRWYLYYEVEYDSPE